MLTPEEGARIAYRKSLWFGRLACALTLVAMTFAVPTVLGAVAVGLFGVLLDVSVAGYLSWTYKAGMLAWFLGGFCAAWALWKTLKVWLAVRVLGLDRTSIES